MSAPEPGFRPAMLLHDARYRSLTIQAVAAVLLTLGLSWLVWNTVQNLQALGKDFDFSFLGQRAGYDINQRLIPYTNASTHARAALVGILNTMLVAVLGCALATVLGILAGVLRLSGNWIVARLMGVYVEAFRNVPVLLWILVILAIMTESMPQPRAFRDGGGGHMLFGSVAVTNRGIYLPAPVWGPGSAVLLAVFALSLAAVWALWRHARAEQAATGRVLPLGRIALAVLVLPSLAAFFLLGRPVGLEVPELGGFNFAGGIHLRNSLIALWLGLSLYTGAFIAEIVRGGILAISRGQAEAAYALGLPPARTMRLVVLPQAMRVIVPPLISQYLNLTKNSSLAIAVGYMDVRSTLGGITVNQTGRELEGILLLAAFYLAVSLLISAGMNLYDRTFRLAER